MEEARTALATAITFPVLFSFKEPLSCLIAWGRHAIESARSVDELRRLHESLKSVLPYMEFLGASPETINAATDLRIRADRRLGEVLAGVEKAKATRGQLSGGDIGSRPEEEPTCPELRMDKNQDPRW